MTPGKAWPGLLLAVLALGAALRFPGLGHGLRHEPHIDERYFVENAAGMLERHDLDPQFYEYPGLFFYLLAPFLAPLSPAARTGPTGYLVARTLVASFSVLNILLAARLGRALAGPGVGLAAAAFEAVNPIAIETAHSVRPDVVLETLVVLALLVFLRKTGDRQDDAASGALLGAATALKFSGALLVFPYLAKRAFERRVGALALPVALVTFALLSPYAILHGAAFLEGARAQVLYHYQPRAQPHSYVAMALSYAAVDLRGLGIPGSVLAALGLGLALRERARVLPFVALPLATVALFGTSGFHFDRHMVPSFPLVAVLAGIGLLRLPVTMAKTLAIGVLALAFPALESARFVLALEGPDTRDRAVDFVASSFPKGARIVTDVPGLGFPRETLEILEVKALTPQSRTQILRGDGVVTIPPGPSFLSLPTLFRVSPESPFVGPDLVVLTVPEEERLKDVPVSLLGAVLSSSEGPADLEAVRDQRLDTEWTSPDAQRHGMWLDLVLQKPVRLVRVELALGGFGEFAGKRLGLEGSLGTAGLGPITTLPGRAPVETQPRRPEGPSQELLLPTPLLLDHVRIDQLGASVRHWGIAELRLYAAP
jgi:hypothetical protein